jgi:hypothetical protein
MRRKKNKKENSTDFDAFDNPVADDGALSPNALRQSLSPSAASSFENESSSSPTASSFENEGPASPKSRAAIPKAVPVSLHHPPPPPVTALPAECACNALAARQAIHNDGALHIL